MYRMIRVSRYRVRLERWVWMLIGLLMGLAMATLVLR